MLGPILGAAYKGKYHKRLYPGAENVAGLGPSLYKAVLTDFSCDWLPRAQTITEYQSIWA